MSRHILTMSHAVLAAAVTKLEHLSEERTGRATSLIEGLAEFEAMEDAADVEAASAALASGDPDQWPILEAVEKRLEL